MKQAASKFKIYTKENCSYCNLAKITLMEQGIDYEEVDLKDNAQAIAFLRLQNFRTVPQIYNGDEHIGGYDELRKYLENGKKVHPRQSA